jgi:hypothetical protein
MEPVGLPAGPSVRMARPSEVERIVMNAIDR